MNTPQILKDGRHRIITFADLREHIAKVRNRCSTMSKDALKQHLRQVGDIAACCTNWYHAEDGHHAFYRDTPAWIVNIAKRNGWIARKGNALPELA